MHPSIEARKIGRFIIVKVDRLNTSFSKTWCRNHDCRYEYSRIVFLKSLLEKYLGRIDEDIVMREVESWGHECGFGPRYFDFIIVIDSSSASIRTMVVLGGNVWKAVLVYRYGYTLFHDGCMGDIFAHVINEIVSGELADKAARFISLSF